MPPLAPLVVKLSHGGAAQRPDAGGRNSKHVQYVATHGALEANAAHVIYQATHDPLISTEGQKLIGNAADAGIQAAIEEAQANHGHQWRWIISLRGDEADRLGYTPDRWHDLAREIAPRLATAAGISVDDLRWVAAHHDPVPGPGQDRHPHLHIALWSAEPTDRPHRLSKDELRQAKRAVAQAIYGPERALIGQERTALREAIRRSSVQILGEALTVAREARSHINIPPGAITELGRRLEDLSAKMPGQGRAALAFMPPDVKAEARSIADWILQHPTLANLVADFRDRTRDLASYYLHDPVRLMAAELRAYEDLRDRVAQSVVRSAAKFNRMRQEHISPPRLRGAARRLIDAAARAIQEQPRLGHARQERRHQRDDGRGRDH